MKKTELRNIIREEIEGTLDEYYVSDLKDAPQELIDLLNKLAEYPRWSNRKLKIADDGWTYAIGLPGPWLYNDALKHILNVKPDAVIFYQDSLPSLSGRGPQSGPFWISTRIQIPKSVKK